MSKQRDPTQGFFAGFALGGIIALPGWSLFGWDDLMCAIVMVSGALASLLWARFAS